MIVCVSAAWCVLLCVPSVCLFVCVCSHRVFLKIRVYLRPAAIAHNFHVLSMTTIVVLPAHPSMVLGASHLPPPLAPSMQQLNPPSVSGNVDSNETKEKGKG